MISLYLTGGFLVLTVAVYLWHVNRAIYDVPPEAQALSPHRWTEQEIRETYHRLQTSPIDIRKSLPPKQNRRYIVLGGAGLVGGWIVLHLLARGEDPRCIRILDIRFPTRPDLLQDDDGSCKVAFEMTDITDERSLSRAFSRPWPDETVGALPLTVFHTVAFLQSWDRKREFLPYVHRINVDGTRNALVAAKAAGASCFVATSSGAVAIRRPGYWIAPWSRWPRHFVQVISESDPPGRAKDDLGDYCSNYAFTKYHAEQLVRGANDRGNKKESSPPFLTGCIRPVNGIFGSTGDMVSAEYLKRSGCPTWQSQTVQSFVYVENVSLAHLLLERRLVLVVADDHGDQAAGAGRSLPDNISGQTFAVTDPNPPVTFGDIYFFLTVLAATNVRFTHVPPVVILIVAHLLEIYSLLRHCLLPLLPPVKGDLGIILPALFSLTTVNIATDDSKARLDPEDGGLGYKAPFTTMEGLCKQVIAWNRVHGEGEGEGETVINKQDAHH